MLGPWYIFTEKGRRIADWALPLDLTIPHVWSCSIYDVWQTTMIHWWNTKGHSHSFDIKGPNSFYYTAGVNWWNLVTLPTRLRWPCGSRGHTNNDCRKGLEERPHKFRNQEADPCTKSRMLGEEYLFGTNKKPDTKKICTSGRFFLKVTVQGKGIWYVRINRH